MGLFNSFKNLNISIKLNSMIILALGLLLLPIIFISSKSMSNLETQTGQQRAIAELRLIQSRFTAAAQSLSVAAQIIASTSSQGQLLTNQDRDSAYNSLMMTAAPFNLDHIKVIKADGSSFLTLPASDSNSASIETFNNPAEVELLLSSLNGRDMSAILSDEQGLWLVSATSLQNESGDIVGALSVSQHIDDDFLEQINFSREGVHLMLLNPQGQIVAHHVAHAGEGQVSAAQLEDMVLDPQHIKQALHGDIVVSAEAHTLADVPQHILAYSPLSLEHEQSPQVVLAVLVRQDALFFFEQQLTRNLILVFLSVALVVFIIVAIFARKSVVNPLNKLMVASSQMAQGNYTQRAEVSSSDEIGYLGLRFNQMAAAIQERDKNLQDLTASLEDRIEKHTADFKSANQQLQQEIASRKHVEEALILARDEAIQADQLKTELLAKVSHELRTPIGVILGYTEIMQEGLYGPLTKRQKTAMGQIVKNADGLTTLVGELLDVAQLEAGQIKFDVSSFPPMAIIDPVYTKMKILAEAKALEFRYHVDEALPPTVEGDLARLQQLLINLVGNAIKFTKQGQVQINIYQADPKQWVMQVSDTGLGISLEAQNYIFDAFRQVDGSNTRLHEGAGLGLALVKHLTTLMGGQIILESQPGHGSTFTVFLPLQATYKPVV